MFTRVDEREIAHMRRLIRAEVSYFNGWQVSDKAVDEACEKAAKKLLSYMWRREQRYQRVNGKKKCVEGNVK
jgi:hypothetical protein